MKQLTVDRITEGQRVADFFAVQECDRKTTQNNKPFLSFVLSDATGTIGGVCWDDVDRLAAVLTPGAVVRVEGVASSYRGELQLKLNDARQVRTDDKIEPSDFMPKTPFDINHMLRQVIDLKNSVQDPHISALLDYFFCDEAFLARFRQHPAAKRLHHAYAGGLLEHTLSVAQSCMHTADKYEELNRDLLIAGALLHDVGKLYEMGGDVTTEYTVHGQLVGHLSIGSELVSRAAATIKGFPPTLKWLVQHLILSHHGEYEFGSPVLPATREAFVLHTLDRLDAQIFQINAAIEDDTDDSSEFTKRVYGLDRFIFKGSPGTQGGGRLTPAPLSAPAVKDEDLGLDKDALSQESLL